HRSRGNSLVRSMSAARGAISRAAKWETVSRRMSTVSPRPKLRPWCMEASRLAPGAAAFCRPGWQTGEGEPAQGLPVEPRRCRMTGATKDRYDASGLASIAAPEKGVTIGILTVFHITLTLT